MTDLMIKALGHAVAKLGGPNRATRVYNEAFAGRRDIYGERIERLARSTLETWVKGTAKTKARDVIDRMIKLGERP
jgi:hypothetical protein